ncbi:NUDIX domain-containing protein [Actinomadura sp. 9N407]|uniref:NUDIX domain-containing protein n=1 Tax=Actinomadura sp. 9N407 TaxID=3375154 RepID=UPI0037AFCE09
MPAFRTDAPLPSALTSPQPRLEFAQKAFITDRDRLLMVRKAPSDPHHPGRWEVPGGRLEVAGDLDLDEHIRREVWEEVGLKIEPGPPFHLWQWYMPDRRDRRSRRPVRGDRADHREPGAFGERARAIRVVAAARLCRPVTREITLENQTPGDHLVDPTWVPLAEIAAYDLIPSLRPVMRAFLLMHPEAAPPLNSLADALPDAVPGSMSAGLSESLSDPLPESLPDPLPDPLSDPLSEPLSERPPEPLPERLPGSFPPGAPAPG